MDPVLEELHQEWKVLRDDIVHTYHDHWEDFKKSLGSVWSSRPWWLRRRPWKDFKFWVLPRDISKGLKKLWGYRQRERTLKECRAIIELHDVDAWLKRSTFGNSLFFYHRIDESVDEARPVMDSLKALGWKIEDSDDTYEGRAFNLTHPDRSHKIRFVARVDWNSSCEIVEHREERTIEDVEYEVVCAGERELTGREL